MSDERRAENRLAQPHKLQGNSIALEHRLERLFGKGRGKAVDMQTVLVRRNDAALKYGVIRFDPGHMSHTHNVADAAEAFKFSIANDCAMIVCRRDTASMRLSSPYASSRATTSSIDRASASAST